MNKKGFSFDSAMVVIVIGIAAILVTYFIYDELYTVSKKRFSEDECRASLTLTRTLNSVQPACWAKVANPIPLKCTRNFLMVKDQQVIFEDKDATKLYSAACPDGTTDCLAKHVVAEEMRKCWGMFDAGEQIFLQQLEVNAYDVFTAKDYQRACFVCAQIDIKTEKPIEKFDEYLKTKTFSKFDPTIKRMREVNYYTYLAENQAAWCDKSLVDSETPNCFEAIASGKATTLEAIKQTILLEEKRPDVRPVTIQTGATYAVTYIRRGTGSCDDTKGGHKTVGGVTFDQHLTNTVQLIPADKIGQACDTVII